ncbi:hypothetical protein R3P38DRAFT_2841402 [Favolaschia claudopus]|uniref:Uncharacterized protein n=1 Tax=Favolaschia claudopus TaxID=2862362 RepID=A0AAW0E010_9AGAR
MQRMPGGLNTPPASPRNQHPVGGEELPQNNDTRQDGEMLRNEHQKPVPPKLQIPTTQMYASLASLSCATRLSPPNGQGLADNNEGSVLTPELIAVGELVSAMKRVVGVLGTTFDSLGEQAERVAILAPTLKATEQIKKLRAEIAKVVSESESQALEVNNLLEEAVKQTLSDNLKAHIRDVVAHEVKKRVTQQLQTQIPDDVRRHTLSHTRQIFEVQRSLHNSEARQHNSALGPTPLTRELRPLLRPLPSAEQSPSAGSVPPARISRTVSHNEEPPTPSPLFPRDLKALFALKPEEAQTLVDEYGLGKQAVPATPIVEVGDSRERNLNKFMAHIGVVGFEMHGFLSSISISQGGGALPSTLIIRILGDP